MNTSISATLDVVIIGGSYAGLSAALCLGRSMRRVTVIDSGKPCNRQTPHSHNFLTHDGHTPAEIRARAVSELAAYPSVSLIHDEITSGSGQNGDFIVTLDSGRLLRARKLLFATGIRDQLPAIPGFAECWGISLLHCPYCHGYEVRKGNLGVITNGDMALEYARMIHHWAGELTLFTNGPATFAPEQQSLLTKHGVAVVEEPIAAIIHKSGYLSGLQLSSGTIVNKEAVFFRAPFDQSCSLPVEMGCLPDHSGLLSVNELGATTVPGIYAAGDNSSPMRSVSAAVAAGTKAGAMLNRELINEDFT